ncbi:MAG: terpene cyclase/mutase family protein [Planctomycetes bacterium]|nr:terpene cyclase/mutase family protein [Planctomycetota bacterium]
MDDRLSRWLVAISFTASLIGGAMAQGEPVLPEHVTEDHASAVERGLRFLSQAQASNGSFVGTRDGSHFSVAMAGLAGMAFLAHGDTSSRGEHADEIKKIQRYLMASARKSGLITSSNDDAGVPMFGHGFALLFLATAYGMENDREVRDSMSEVIRRGISLTAKGQSSLGGWMYYPGGGDEGSVTITQMQALRACHGAGFLVPDKTVRNAIRYLERCKTKDGGIRYSYSSGPQTAVPITCAAVATLYNAGDYESDLAKSCLALVRQEFRDMKQWGGGRIGGHSFYANLYAAQAFYQAGDEAWDEYFPRFSRMLLKKQQGDGSWEGDGVGQVFGTACALIILQLPRKLLPIYQR